MDFNDIKSLTLVITFIFLIAPIFVLIYISVYNKRKQRFIQEREQMKLTFETEMAKTQFEVREQTMQTIGADLHDNIGQLLSLISLTLNSIELDNVNKTKEKIEASIDLTLRSIKEMRLLGHLLQGDQLIALGLSEAIGQEIAWMERSGRFEISYTASDEIPADNNADKDLIIFRTVQEMFNNIIKHAAATRIVVNLGYGEGTLKLCVCDNGVGFSTDDLPLDRHGMGLQNIRKRAGIIGGEATVISNPGEGTQITIFIPYP